MPRVKFRPNTDGFAFNNGFDLSTSELATVDEIVKKASAAALAVLTPSLGPVDVVLSLFGVPPGALEAGTAIAISAGALDNLINTGFAHTGFCGGMAWTACDYWMQGWAVQRGGSQATASTITDPRAKTLRDYLWHRHLDTYSSGVAVDTLTWMAILKLVPEGAGGGAPALVHRSRDEWHKLKSVLDQGRPCPLVLIYDEWNPGKNHQVLAYGYEGDLPGTVKIFVYDNNHMDVETELVYDFGGNTFAGNDRGFFVPSYSPKRPPISLALIQSLATTPVPPYTLGETVTFSYAVQNFGCGNAVPITCGVHGYEASAWVLDTPQKPKIPSTRPPQRLSAEGPPEKTPQPMHQTPEKNFFAHQAGAPVSLVSGSSIATSVVTRAPSGYWDVTAVVDVGPIDGRPSYKVVPKGNDSINDHLRLSIPARPAAPTPAPNPDPHPTPATPAPHPASPHPIPHILRPR